MMHDTRIPTFKCQCGGSLNWEEFGAYWRSECSPCHIVLTILKSAYRPQLLEFTAYDEFGIDPTPDDSREWEHYLQ